MIIMKELIEKLNSMTEEEAKAYIESLSEEETCFSEFHILFW